MEIPKIITANNRRYILVKEYPSHILYRDAITGTRTSFQRYDLGIIEEKATRGTTGYHRNFNW